MLRLHNAAILVSLLWFHNARVLGQTVTVEGFDGGTVILPCAFASGLGWLRLSDLSWSLRPNLIVRKVSTEVIFSPGPYEGDISLVNNFDLRISPLRRDRDGNTGQGDKIFECNNGRSRQQIQLRLLERISSVSIGQTSGGKVNVMAGTSKTLTCSVSGDPDSPPSYSWSIDDVTFSGQTSSSFTFTPDKSMKAIKCTATNRYSNGSVLSVKEVIVPLDILYLDPPSTQSSYTVIENDPVTLCCSTHGNPLPSYQWRRPGISLADFNSTSAEYTIENVDRTAAGKYFCRVKNVAGSYENATELIVQYNPNPNIPKSINRVAAILGGISALVVLVIITIVAILLFRKHRRKPEETRRPAEEQTARFQHGRHEGGEYQDLTINPNYENTTDNKTYATLGESEREAADYAQYEDPVTETNHGVRESYTNVQEYEDISFSVEEVTPEYIDVCAANSHNTDYENNRKSTNYYNVLTK